MSLLPQSPKRKILHTRRGIALMSSAAALVGLGVTFMPQQVFSTNPEHVAIFHALICGIGIGFGGALAIALLMAPIEIGGEQG